MQFNLDEAVSKIKNHKDFLMLRDFIENNRGHDHEPAYDHSIATFERMKNLLNGDLLINADAREESNKFLDQKVGGISKRDLLLIAALLHDIGKGAVVERDGKKVSINKINSDGTTISPDHGYWGSLIVPQITEDLSLPAEAVGYLSNIVKLHMGPPTFPNSSEEVINDLKQKLENFHVEILLLMFADIFNHPDFQKQKPVVNEVLNNPNFYK